MSSSNIPYSNETRMYSACFEPFLLYRIDHCNCKVRGEIKLWTKKQTLNILLSWAVVSHGESVVSILHTTNHLITGLLHRNNWRNDMKEKVYSYGVTCLGNRYLKHIWYKNRKNGIASKHSSTTNHIHSHEQRLEPSRFCTINQVFHLVLFDTKQSQLWVTPSIGKELNLCHLLTDESI